MVGDGRVGVWSDIEMGRESCGSLGTVWLLYRNVGRCMYSHRHVTVSGQKQTVA